MPTSTVTSKGQITIPKKVRERLGLSSGDRLLFRFDEEGRLVVEPESPISWDGSPASSTTSPTARDLHPPRRWTRRSDVI